MESRALHLSPTRGSILSAISSGLREAIDFVTRPEKWVFLSCCDWYPDGSSYPTNHAAMLRGKPAAGGSEDA